MKKLIILAMILTIALTGCSNSAKDDNDYIYEVWISRPDGETEYFIEPSSKISVWNFKGYRSIQINGDVYVVSYENSLVKMHKSKEK